VWDCWIRAGVSTALALTVLIVKRWRGRFIQLMRPQGLFHKTLLDSNSSSRPWIKPKIAMKNKRACQTSINTHPVHATEVNAERDKIIATLYTVNSNLSTAIFADSSRIKASLLGIEDRLIVQVGDSVAFLRSSEEDVYYRIDSMLFEGRMVSNV
jgi:hypothetical protein